MWILLPRGTTLGQFVDTVDNYVFQHLDGAAEYSIEYRKPGYHFSTTNQELDAFVEANYTDQELEQLIDSDPSQMVSNS